MAACRDCDDEVRWAMLPNGKKMMFDMKPLDAPPSPGRRFVMLPGENARIATSDDIRLHRQIYTCHWDTCRKKARR